MDSAKRQELKSSHCKPCEGGVERLSQAEAERLLQAVPEWKLSDDGKRITRRWKLEDFAAAMRLIQHAATIAEAENHHPDLHVTDYCQVSIELSTHAIDGLSENDFIVAAKISDLDQAV